MRASSIGFQVLLSLALVAARPTPTSDPAKLSAILKLVPPEAGGSNAPFAVVEFSEAQQSQDEASGESESGEDVGASSG